MTQLTPQQIKEAKSLTKKITKNVATIEQSKKNTLCLEEKLQKLNKEAA